jgi:hypothetical protein
LPHAATVEYPKIVAARAASTFNVNMPVLLLLLLLLLLPPPSPFVLAASVEYPKIVAARAASTLNINGPVLLANACAAFALNLVRQAAGTVVGHEGKLQTCGTSA